jgi:hypothetical protein
LVHFRIRRGIFAQNPLVSRLAIPPKGRRGHVGTLGPGICSAIPGGHDSADHGFLLFTLGARPPVFPGFVVLAPLPCRPAGSAGFVPQYPGAMIPPTMVFSCSLWAPGPRFFQVSSSLLLSLAGRPGPRDLFRNNGALPLVLRAMILPCSLWAPGPRFFQVSSFLLISPWERGAITESWTRRIISEIPPISLVKQERCVGSYIFCFQGTNCGPRRRPPSAIAGVAAASDSSQTYIIPYCYARGNHFIGPFSGPARNFRPEPPRLASRGPARGTAKPCRHAGSAGVCPQ